MTALVFRLQRVISMWFANELMQDRLKSSRNPLSNRLISNLWLQSICLQTRAVFEVNFRLNLRLYETFRRSEGLRVAWTPRSEVADSD